MGFWVGVSIRFVWHFLGRNHVHGHILSIQTSANYFDSNYISRNSHYQKWSGRISNCSIYGAGDRPPWLRSSWWPWAMGLPRFCFEVMMFMVWGLGLAMVFCKSPSASSKRSLRVRKFNPQNEGLAELFVLLGSASASRAGFTINKTSELRENGHKLN